MSNLLKSVVASSQQKKSVLEKLGAVFAIDAKYSKTGEQWVLNRGSGGQVLRAKYGSVARAEIRNGVGLVLSGATANYASVPDAANLDITGSIEVVVRASCEDITTVTSKTLISKVNTGSDNYSWTLEVYQSTLYFVWTTGGTSATQAFASADFASVLAGGAVVWLKATMDATSGKGRLYWAADSATEPSSWTEMTTGAGAGGPTSIFSGAANVCFGTRGNGNQPLLGGQIKRGIIRNGIGGTTALDVDFTKQADLATSFTCATGQTVTVTAANAVDTNDPLLLPWSGENYLHVPSGNAANNASVPSDVPPPTTQFEIIQRVWLADWTPATTAILGQRTAFADPGYNFVLALLTNGTFRLTIYPLAAVASATIIDATVPNSLTDDRWYWLRVTFDGNDGAGNRRTNFYYAPDSAAVPTSWTQIGSEVVTASTVSFTAPTGGSRLYMSGGSHTAPDARCKRFIYRTTIGGATVLDVDFTQNTDHSSFVCSTGQTVTIARTTSGRKTAMVTRPIWLFGTDDYLEVADNDLLDFGATDDFTILAIGRVWTTAAANGRFVDKTDAVSGAVPGYTLYTFGSSNDLRTYMFGAASILSPDINPLTFSYGNLSVFAGVANRTSQTLTSYVNNTSGGAVSISTVGSVATSGALRVGNRAAAGRALDAEILAVGIFRRTLSAAEVAQIVSAYRTS